VRPLARLKICNLDAIYVICITTNYHKHNFPHSQKIKYTLHKTQHQAMSRYKSNNASDDSSFKDSGNEGEGERDMSKEGLWNHINQLHEMCQEKERVIKKLKVELKLSKSPGRNTKQKIRLDYQWDREDANLADKVLDWVKTYLFPRCKFLKRGWMEFSKKWDSLSAFVKRKMESSIPSTSDYRDLWERVICPTIQNKYMRIGCNLMNDIRMTYRGEYGDECLLFVQMISQSFVHQCDRGSEPEKGGPGHSGK
jgi:hypothetical protein